MRFEPLRLPAILPAGAQPRTVAGTCEAGWRTIIARLAFSFGSRALCAFRSGRIAAWFTRFPGAGAKQIRGLIHAAARAFHNPRCRVSKSNPRHSKASVVMIDHHTEGFGNVPTGFGA